MSTEHYCRECGLSFDSPESCGMCHALKTHKDEWPECREFYELMQTYRLVPIDSPADVTKAYENVKSWIRGRR